MNKHILTMFMFLYPQTTVYGFVFAMVYSQ